MPNATNAPLIFVYHFAKHLNPSSRRRGIFLRHLDPADSAYPRSYLRPERQLLLENTALLPRTPPHPPPLLIEHQTASTAKYRAGRKHPRANLPDFPGQRGCGEPGIRVLCLRSTEVSKGLGPKNSEGTGSRQFRIKGSGLKT